jgi:hypothetical protein
MIPTDAKRPVYRVLVRTGEHAEPGGTVERLEPIEVTEAQYHAYAAGDPAWRSARGPGDGGWFGRAWRRLFGGDA